MACSIECPLISRAPVGRRNADPRMRSREAMALEAPAGHGVECSRGCKGNGEKCDGCYEHSAERPPVMTLLGRRSYWRRCRSFRPGGGQMTIHQVRRPPLASSRICSSPGGGSDPFACS